MRKVLSLLLVLGFVAVLLSACGKEEVVLDTITNDQSSTQQSIENKTDSTTDQKPDESKDAKEDPTTNTEDPTNDVQEDQVKEDVASSDNTPVQSSNNEWFTQVVSAKVVSQSEGALEWKNKDGKTVNFATAGGKVYLIDVWAEWCPPCKASTPTMISMYNKYKDQGLVVIGINTDTIEKLEIAKEFATAEGITYPVLHDPQSQTVGGVYVGQGIPQFTLLDSTGKVYFTNTGAITEGSNEATQLESAIRKALGL
jgi:thiol-disulfide isomerase/thioredoxin